MRGRLALVGAAAALGLVSGTARPVAAAGCAALEYRAGVGAAAAHLRGAAPDVVAAGADIARLLRLAPTPSTALKPVIADLSAVPPDVTDAVQRLDAISAALAYPANSTCSDTGAGARAALHDVYATPAFRHLDDQQPQGSLLGSLASWVGDRLAGVVGAVGPLGGVAILLLILALGAGLLVRVLRARTRSAVRGADEPPALGDDPDAEWRLAERAAAAGDNREAVRRAFRAALLDVAGRGHVPIEAAWTTRELLARLDAEPEVLVALAAAAASFDRAWYSGAVVTPADWQAAATQCAAIRRLTRRSLSTPR